MYIYLNEIVVTIKNDSSSNENDSSSNVNEDNLNISFLEIESIPKFDN
jgi:hypothetical protein